MTAADLLAQIPADAPAWVVFAARMAVLDDCDWSDRAEVETVLGAMDDERWARFGRAVAVGIQYASEVAITEGWVEPAWAYPRPLPHETEALVTALVTALETVPRGER